MIVFGIIMIIVGISVFVYHFSDQLKAFFKKKKWLH